GVLGVRVAGGGGQGRGHAVEASTVGGADERGRRGGCVRRRVGDRSGQQRRRSGGVAGRESRVADHRVGARLRVREGERVEVVEGAEKREGGLVGSRVAE